MALTKEILIDRIEVLETGIVQVRQATRIIENEEMLSQSFHRWLIQPGEDYSDQPDNVKSICQAVHTPKVIADYKKLLESKKLG